MYNLFFNKYKYRLERCHDLISYLIINHPRENEVGGLTVMLPDEY